MKVESFLKGAKHAIQDNCHIRQFNDSRVELTKSVTGALLHFVSFEEVTQRHGTASVACHIRPAKSRRNPPLSAIDLREFPKLVPGFGRYRPDLGQ